MSHLAVETFGDYLTRTVPRGPRHHRGPLVERHIVTTLEPIR